jgi:hypothetical protein
VNTDSILSQLAHALLLPLILGGLALLFPYRKTAVLRPLSPEEMKAVQATMTRYNWLGLLLFFVTTPILIWLAYDFFKTLHRLLPRPTRDFSHVFPYDESFWLIPAALIGFGMTMPVMAWLANRYYGVEKYALINHAYNQQYGFDGEVVMKWMTRLFVGLGLLSAWFCYHTYAGIRGREVVIHSLTELRERRYPFDQLRRLTFVDYQLIYPNKTEEWPYYEMAFDDGSGGIPANRCGICRWKATCPCWSTCPNKPASASILPSGSGG